MNSIWNNDELLTNEEFKHVHGSDRTQSEKTKTMNRQYTCPACGQIGAHPEDSKPPLCHKCDYKVVMEPSHNGKIGK